MVVTGGGWEISNFHPPWVAQQTLGAFEEAATSWRKRLQKEPQSKNTGRMAELGVEGISEKDERGALTSACHIPLLIAQDS